MHYFFIFRGLVKYYEDRYNRNGRYGYEHQSFIFGLLARKQPKRHPGISYMGQAKKLFHHLHRMIDWNMERNHEFGVLIQHDQGSRYEK